MAMAKDKYPYPSQFGSHASMVVKEETEQLADDKLVVCKDAYGMYVTEKDRLDCGLADPNRNCNPKWRTKNLEEFLSQVIDIIENHEGEKNG
jgi:hypothetical protein